MISCYVYSYNHWENQHICLQCSLNKTPNYKWENGWFLLDQNYIYSFFGQNFVNTSEYSAPGVQHIKNSKRQFNSSEKKSFIHQNLGCIFPFWNSFHISQKVTVTTGITAIDRNSCSFDSNPPQKGMWNLGLKEPEM